MPISPFPLVPVPGVEIEVPALDGLRIGGLPQRARDRDRRNARGRRDALLGRTERRLDPEFGEREGEAAQGRDRVDDDRRVYGVRGPADRRQGGPYARGPPL